MPRPDMSRFEMIPTAERRPGGPEYRLRSPGGAVSMGLPAAPGKDHPPAPRRGPNATETRIRDALITIGKALEQALHEGETFPIAGGAVYTPDWVAPGLAVECKGEHIHSRDSRRRFDEARERHPGVWVWARERTKGMAGKRLVVEVYES